MKKLLGWLYFMCGMCLAETPSMYQRIDPKYSLFNFSTELEILSNEGDLFVYESPYGHIYDGGQWRHAEFMGLDLRRIAIDFGPLKNVPILFGMSYKTWPRDPYASSFQVNRVQTSFITPSIEGFFLEYEVQALSNSGRQGSAVYSRLYYRSNFGLSPDPRKNLVSFSVAYCQTNGLGYIVVPPQSRDVDYSKLTWDDMFGGQGYFWIPTNGYVGNLTIDLAVLDVNDYLSVGFEHFWNNDPNWPRQHQNFWRYELNYGNTYQLGNDVKLQVEAGVNNTQNLYSLKGKAIVTIQTNFN